MEEGKTHGAADADNNAIVITVTKVTQDEPVNALGDEDTSPDAVIQGDKVYAPRSLAGL